MSTRHYPRYVGVRFTEDEYRGLHHLIKASGSNKSDVIRFLVRMAAQRPDVVASGLRREKVKPSEPQS